MQKEFPKNNINRKILYLALWIIFFIVIAFIIMTPERNKEQLKNQNTVDNITEDEFEIPSKNKNTDKFNSFKNMLLNKKFDFKYTYSGPEGTVVYTGNIDNNIINVTVENKDGISKYYVENDLVYITKLDEKIITDYDIDHKSYFDIDYLLEIATEDAITNEENEIKFSLPDGYGILFYENDIVNKIEIYVDITTYTLEFSNIK